MWVLDDIDHWRPPSSRCPSVWAPEGRRRPRRVSPVAQTARIRNPLLLRPWEEDVRVPPEHGYRRLRDAMTKGQNQCAQYVEYKNGAMAGRASRRVDFAKRVEAFLAKHLAK